MTFPAIARAGILATEYGALRESLIQWLRHTCRVCRAHNDERRKEMLTSLQVVDIRLRSLPLRSHWVSVRSSAAALGCHQCREAARSSFPGDIMHQRSLEKSRY